MIHAALRFSSPAHSVAARLTGLMALYESNYRRLQRLLPERSFPLDAAISTTTDGAPELHLEILERTRYTLTLRLSHRARAGEAAMHIPDQWLRVYHDAGMAEALSPPGRDDPPAHALVLRWGRNYRLNGWLAQWLAQGHGFVHLGRPRRQG